jgi:hypothetical protein
MAHASHVLRRFKSADVFPLSIVDTAGPSTTLRSGRDDNFVAQEKLSSRLPRLAVGPERTRISCYAALTNARVCGFQ